MACGSCGKRKQTVSQQQARAITGQSAAKYTVRAPDGTSQTFDRYIDAAVHRRQVNGTLTTHG